jgi:cytochrome c oxidase subunit 2
MSKFSLLPEQASTVAPQVDLLLFFLLGVSFFFAMLIAGMILVFMVRYRRRPGRDHDRTHGPLWLEAAWTAIPFAITMVMFFWGASLYATIRRARRLARRRRRGQAVDVEAAAHGGPARDQRAARPDRPARAAQHDVRGRHPQLLRAGVPREAGRRARTLLVALVRGDEGGRVPPLLRGILRHAALGDDRPHRRDGARRVRGVARRPAAGRGERAGRRRGRERVPRAGCGTCHRADGSGQGPPLAGAFGKTVKLANGDSLVVDEGYIRESILNPQAKVVEGYKPVMPTYQGLLSEEDVMRLIAYVKSLRAGEGGS